MQNLPTSEETVADRERIEQLVLNLIVDPEQKPWSLEEILRSLQSVATQLDIQDALCDLRDVGLLNQADQIYFASQAAAHAAKLGMMEL